MAITVNYLLERIEDADADVVNCDYGHAHKRLLNLISIIKTAGIIIHATATVDEKRIEVNDNTEE